MRSRSNFWLGVVVGAILGAAILFSIYYVPRKGISLSREPLGFTVVLKESHGLTVGSPVLVSGVEAGEVVDVRVEELEGLGWRVLAGVSIFDGEQFGPALRTGSVFQVGQTGLLGETTLAIAPGGPGERLVEGAFVDGTPPMDLGAIVEDVEHVTQRLSDFMDGRQQGDPSLRRTLKDLQLTIRNLKDFSEKLP